MRCLELAVDDRRSHRNIRVRTISAKELDQGNLDRALAGHSSRADESERRVQCLTVGARAGVEDHCCDLQDIRTEPAMADWILRNEFEQRRILKIVASLEHHPL